MMDTQLTKRVSIHLEPYSPRGFHWYQNRLIENSRGASTGHTEYNYSADQLNVLNVF